MKCASSRTAGRQETLIARASTGRGMGRGAPTPHRRRPLTRPAADLSPTGRGFDEMRGFLRTRTFASTEMLAPGRSIPALGFEQTLK